MEGGVWRCERGCGDGEVDVNAIFNHDGGEPSSLLGGCELVSSDRLSKQWCGGNNDGVTSSGAGGS